MSGETTGLADSSASAAPWTAAHFFSQLAELGPLRVMTQSGPSTFEALCRVGPFGISQGYLNAIAPAYHWHLRLEGFRHLRSRDEIHRRSGRRVLYFELRSAARRAPFIAIYLHRPPGAELASERRFAALHGELAGGVPVVPPGEEAS